MQNTDIAPGRFSLSDFLDRFIPGDMQADAETHRRTRMFMLSHVFGPVLGMSIPLYMSAFGISRDMHVLIFFGLILSFWIYPFLLRATGRYQLLAFVSVQNLIFCVLWACYAYGGMTSPFLPWFLILPLLAFLYLPPQGWVRNVLLAQIFGSIGLFIAYCFGGAPLPHVNLDELETIGMISMASVAIYFAMMSLYFAKMYREQGQFARELNSLVSTSDNLRNLTAAADQASHAKAAFVAGMSHELRTPLNAIIGYSQLLLEEAEDEGDDGTVADIGHIHEAGTHLLTLIDDILSLSRIEAGRMPVNPAIDTLEAQGPTWLAGPRLAHADAAVVLRRGDDEPATLDWTLVRAIVQHIVLGIGQQSPGGHTRIEAAMTADTLVIAFVHRDATGAVRSFDVNADIFETADDSSAAHYGATGIEFPLAQRLTELLGGTLSADPLAGGVRLTLDRTPCVRRLAA